MCQAAGRRKKGDSVQVVGRPLPRVKVLCALLASCLAAGAFANPTGPSVVSGSAAFSSAGGALTVSNSPNAIINWQGFSIGAGELTRFQQQSAASAVLNRVVGQDPSAILGTLWSNGRVFLVNPNGIVFGQGSRVDAAAFGASTLNISDADFLGGRLNFQAGAIAKPIVNQGELQSATGGYIYLVSPDITNSGLISSPQGAVVLAAGRTVSLADIGTPNLKVEVSAPEATVRNLGQIVADSGRIGVYAGLIHQQGSVQANSASRDAAGRIVLRASDTALLEQGSVTSANGPAGGAISIGGDVVINTGRVEASGAAGGSIAVAARNYLGAGTLRADGEAGNGGEVSVNATGRIIQTSAEQVSAKGTQQGGSIVINAGERIFSSATLDASGGRGGEVSMLAPEILLLAATIDASGASGGGTVLIGGDYHGANPAVPNANTNWINSFTTINADAKESGDGGRVVIWSDQETRFYGRISARGGAQSGNGGLIEVSSKEKLIFGGTADAGAPNGAAGMLLLDPKNIVIDAAASGGGNAMLLADPNPNAGDGTGMSVTVLANNNIVVAQPNDDFAAANAGAAYLYSGTTGALLATLTGSQASDAVGSGGVTALTNGNYVVSTPSWSNGGAARAGAATFGNGSTGISGAVSAANSLVGSIADDRVAEPSTTPGAEHPGVVALTNGNYVVISHRWTNGAQSFAGAATWGDGTTGIVGPVSAANSLVGTTSLDRVGSHGATALTNGNYVVRSALWTNGGAARAGAATFGSGTTGITGAVTTANSLVGSAVDDNVGGTVTALTNGNYVVTSPNWANGGVASAGAVTWANGTTGITGAVSAANSLVGTTADDQVGIGGVTALTNGNYVVRSFRWDNGATVDAGAVTWGNGTTGITGAVSAANSLVGTTTNDFVGIGPVTALSNGNYVVSSPGWDNGATVNAGAATWGNGTSGITGAVSAGNSLVGTTADDQVGGLVTALTNGNYVVSSPSWDNGATVNAGAATWGNGTTGITGAVSAANSLVGTTAFDVVGIFGVTALSNGNYVVRSPNWDNGATVDAGAVTWGNGTTGITGAVSAANSLVSTTANDQVGNGGVTALSNGNYVVRSPNWANGGAANAGAVTFASGTTGINGAVSAANSLVGTTASDSVGSGGVFPLAGSNYVVSSPVWNNGAAASAGAVTLGDGALGIAGAVSAANSLVGTVANDQIGSGGITGLSNGNYVVSSPLADGGGLVDAGLVHLTSANLLGFSFNPGASVTISPASITSITNAGTAVTLQANNDITLNPSSPITTSAGGTGGAITMQAGRSILINSSITTDNGPITLIANERVANGVVDAQRDPGSAVITMAPGTTINAGSAPMFIQVADGLGLTNSARGDITVANLATTGLAVLIYQGGSTGGIRQQANSVITAGTLYADSPGSVALDNFPSGTGHLVNTLAGLTFSDFNFKNGQSLTVGLGPCCGPGGLSAGGNVNISASGSVTFNANVSKFGFGGPSTLQVMADQDIIVAGGKSISATDTANPLNIVFARASSSPSGIMIGDGVTTSTIDSKGGNITLGRDGPNGGGTVATGGNGLWLNKATVNAGTGNINVVFGLGQLGAATGYGALLSNGAVLQTTTGNIHIDAYGSQFSPGGGVNAGVKLIDAATKITTASGSINIFGVGGTGGPEQSLGIWVANGAVIEATGSGSVLLTGIGGVAAGGNNHGLLIDGAGTRVSTAGGALTMFGTASGYNGFGPPTPTTGGPNVGIFLDNGALVETTGAGAISLTGSSVGSTDAGSNRGILVQGVSTTVRSANGTVTLTGTGGNTTGLLGGGLSSFNDGIRVASGGAVESTGTGGITMIGTGGTSVDGGQNNGIALNAGRVQTGSGAITLTGTGAGAGAKNAGVFLDTASQIISTGSTTITGSGSNDPSATNSRGIDLNSGSISSTISLTLNGTGGTASSGVVTAAGTSATGGTISVQAISNLSVGGSVGATNSATLTADDMDIAGTVSAVNTVTLSPLTASRDIAIATTALGCGSLCIGPAEIQNVSTTTLAIGRTDGTGSLSVNEAITPSNFNSFILQLRGGTVNFNAGVSTPNAGGPRTLHVEAKQDVLVAGGVTIAAADTANPLIVEFIPNEAGLGGGVRVGNGGPASMIDTKGGAVVLGEDLAAGVVRALGTTASGGPGVALNNATVDAGSGILRLAGRGQAGANFSPGVYVGPGSVVQAATGTVLLNGVGGDAALIGNTNPGVYVSGAGTRVGTVLGSVTVIGQGSSIGPGPSHGIVVDNGAIVEATGSGTVNFAGSGSSAAGGIGIFMYGTGTRVSSVNGDISLSGTAGAANRALEIDSGALIESTGGGAIALTAVGDLFMGAPTAAPTIRTNTGPITLAGTTDVFLQGVLQSTSGGPISIGTTGGTINLFGAPGSTLTTSGNVALSANSIQQASMPIVAGGVTTITASTVGLTVANNDFASVVLNATGSVFLTDQNAINFGTSSTGSSSLIVNSSGPITQSGAITAGSATFNAGSNPITLTHGSNHFSGAVNLTGSSASITDVSALSLGTLALSGDLTAGATGSLSLGLGAVGGNLVATSNGGAITQSGGLAVVGSSTFNAGAGSITLANASNDFGGAVSLTGGVVAITDVNAISFGASSAGSLTVNAGGAITQTAPITTGAASFNAGANPITLMGAGNDFTGAVTLTGSSASITDANALLLGTVSLVSGSLAVSASGAITQSGPITAGPATFFTLPASPITLTNAGNDFSGAVSLTGGAVSLTDANALDLGLANVSSLNVTAGGAITQSAPLSVSGTATFAAGSNAITLANAGNDFGGAVSLGGGAVSITDTNSLTLGLVNASSLTANAASITQDASGVVVSGTSTLNAGSIALALGTNDFGTVVATSAGPVALADVNSITLGATSASSLSVSAFGGSITQSGPITAGSSSFFAGASPITLTNAGNDFTGPVTLGGGIVAITDANAVTLSGVNASSLTVNAASITQDASGIAVSGTSTLNAGSITLTSATNDFGTVSAASAGNVSLTDTNALVLGTTSASSLNVTAGGAITQSGAATVSGTSTFAAGTNPVTLTNASNDFGGTVTLTGGAVSITDANALTLGAVNASSLTVNATSLTQDASGVVVSGTSTLNAGSVTLTAATNDFGTVAATSAVNVSLTDANAIALGSVNATSLNVTAGGAITQSGPITAGAASFSAGANPITLTNAGNDFTGAVSLTGGAVSLTDANALDLGSVNVSSLNVVSGGAITQSAPLSVSGATTLAAGSNAITLANVTNDFGGPVSLGGAAASITDANALTLGLVNASSLTVNAASITQDASGLSVSGTTTLNAGSIALTTATNDFGTLAATSGGSVAVTDANAISLGAINSASLNVTAGGAITQSAPLSIGGASTFAAGANPITLTNAANDFTGAVSLTGGTVAITDANSLTLGTFSTGDLSAVSTGALNLGQGTVGGNLVATSNGGAITQSGPLAVTGSSTLNAGAGSLTLGNAGNDFTGALSLTGSSAAITDANALVLGSVSLGGGSLTVNTSGAITQSGPITAGAESFSAGANPITLTNAGNDFTGAVSLTGGAVSLTDANALDLGSVNVSSLNVVSGGAITQSAPLSVSGTATFAAGANAITLANVTNDFGGPVSLGGGAVALTDANALTLGLVNASSLTVNATSITQDASGLSVSGTTTLNAGSIALTTATNVFGTLVTTSGGSVSVTDANAVSLGAINAASLNVTAGGAITQSAPVTVSGASAFAAGANPITLTNASNDFTGAVNLTGSSAAITDANALALGTVSLGGGSLTANASGAITQTGPITAGASSFSAGANPITLTNAGNDFTGAVSLTGGAVSLTIANALDLGLVNVSSLNVVAGGAITQSGPIAAGTTSLGAGSNAITLPNATNDFTGAVSLTGGAVSITDANALTLGTLATGALTAVSTGALNLGQGAVGGNLVATSNGGAITQSGGLTVAGTSSLDAGASSITLANAGNDFGGAVSLSGSSASIADANALTLGTVSLGGGSLVVTASGAITQSGSITAGAASFNAGSNPITLANPGNDFSGAVSLSGGDVTITDANVLTLGAVNASSLTANCASFNQDGSGIVVTGPSTLTAGQITLNSATNAFDTVNVAGTLDASTGTLTAVTWNLLSGGTLKGAGTVTGNVNNSGTISPGASPGTLTINGNFVQASSGVLNMEIAGLTPGTQHDQLVVNGNATLGGTLNATPIGGFSLAPGDSFALVRSSGVITGTFGAIAQPGGVLLNGIYGSASFDLIVSTGSVPLAVQPSLNYAVATTQPASTSTTTQSSPVTTTTTISEGENAASTSDPGAATEEKKVVGRPLRCKS